MPGPAYPLQARDALHALFRKALRSPASREAFLRLLGAAKRGPIPSPELKRSGLEALEGRREYLLDRAPRFLRVLMDRRAGRESGLSGAVGLGQRLLNAGLFFDCHEYLETAWKRAVGERKVLLQGLIQIGAGLHKLELDPAAKEGALYLLDRGLMKLERTIGLLSAPERLEPIREIRRRLAEGCLDLDDLPEVRLVL